MPAPHRPSGISPKSLSFRDLSKVTVLQESLQSHCPSGISPKSLSFRNLSKVTVLQESLQSHRPLGTSPKSLSFSNLSKVTVLQQSVQSCRPNRSHAGVAEHTAVGRVQTTTGYLPKTPRSYSAVSSVLYKDLNYVQARKKATAVAAAATTTTSRNNTKISSKCNGHSLIPFKLKPVMAERNKGYLEIHSSGGETIPFLTLKVEHQLMLSPSFERCRPVPC